MTVGGAPASAEGFGIAPPGGGLPAGLRLGRVRLAVGDLDRSLAFYQRVMGMRVLDASVGDTTLGAAGSGEPLLELRELPGAAPAPRHGRLGLYHFAVLLPDRPALGRFVTHARGLGLRLGGADHLVSESLYLHDPDGLGIEVYADRPRSAWRSDGRELVMSTLPLDLAEVAREAGGEAWAGLPQGSVIGHLHLHVADLEIAAGFYHAVLGLRSMVWSYPGALFLAAPGYHHHLGLNTWAADPTPAPADQARLVDWEIRLPAADDLRRAVERLAAAGHRVESAGTAAGGGSIATQRVRDPWGTALRLSAPAAPAAG